VKIEFILHKNQISVMLLLVIVSCFSSYVISRTFSIVFLSMWIYIYNKWFCKHFNLELNLHHIVFSIVTHYCSWIIDICISFDLDLPSREQKLNKFISWCHERGAKSDKVELTAFEEFGLGLRATQKINVGYNVIKSLNFIISLFNVYWLLYILFNILIIYW